MPDAELYFGYSDSFLITANTFVPANLRVIRYQTTIVDLVLFLPDATLLELSGETRGRTIFYLINCYEPGSFFKPLLIHDFEDGFLSGLPRASCVTFQLVDNSVAAGIWLVGKQREVFPCTIPPDV